MGIAGAPARREDVFVSLCIPEAPISTQDVERVVAAAASIAAAFRYYEVLIVAGVDQDNALLRQCLYRCKNLRLLRVRTLPQHYSNRSRGRERGDWRRRGDYIAGRDRLPRSRRVDDGSSGASGHLDLHPPGTCVWTPRNSKTGYWPCSAQRVGSASRRAICARLPCPAPG